MLVQVATDVVKMRANAGTMRENMGDDCVRSSSHAISDTCVGIDEVRPFSLSQIYISHVRFIPLKSFVTHFLFSKVLGLRTHLP